MGSMDARNDASAPACACGLDHSPAKQTSYGIAAHSQPYQESQPHLANSLTHPSTTAYQSAPLTLGVACCTVVAPYQVK
jgi:hypothetical protein